VKDRGPIRIEKPETRYESISVACSRTLRARVEAVAKQNGVSRSTTLRTMIEYVLPAFEAHGTIAAGQGQTGFYNYLVSTAELALTRYIQTGNPAHLRQAIRRLTGELELRERQHVSPAEEEAPTEEAGAGETG
jgi:hypothetical protein